MQPLRGSWVHAIPSLRVFRVGSMVWILWNVMLLRRRYSVIQMVVGVEVKVIY